MARFVYLMECPSIGGWFDKAEDNQRINEILANLQANRATIISVTRSLANASSANSSVYLITYDATAPIDV